jgi:UDP-glucose 4-epimerase
MDHPRAARGVALVKVLLTGATGFLGSQLLPALAAEHEVVAVTRRPPPDHLRPHATWIELDLSQELEPSRLPQELGAVVHLAQSEHYKAYPAHADDVFAINVASTFALVEHAVAAGASHFVFTSTGGVYGPSGESLSESAPTSAIDFYLSSKLAAELLIQNYRGLMHVIVFRPFFIYGPGQRAMLIPRLAERVRSGQTVQIQGDPGLRINPIHVDDAARVFAPALCLEDSGLFNLAGDEAVTLTELVELLGEVYGVEPDIAHVGGAPAGDLVGQNSLMREVLGIRPRVSLREGLREVATHPPGRH